MARRRWFQIHLSTLPGGALELKARATLNEATVLRAANHFDGSASRAYYSLSQALRPSFERWFSPKSFDKNATRWTHEILVENCDKFVSADQKRIVNKAFKLRVTADYRPDHVAVADLDEVLAALPAILNRLKVPK